jgi:CheY-like chemotaxis protein
VLNHKVELHSTHGMGTDFRILMPLDTSKSAEAAAAALPADATAQPLKGLRILCIDNEPKILEGMRLLIEGWGCNTQAVDALSAVQALSIRQPPDLVIADYHLADGTGIEAILHLRQHFGVDIPSLLVTADRTLEVRAEAEKHGIAVQHKPVRPAALRAYITQISGMKRAAAE